MVKLELEPRQSNPRIWAPNHNILYKTLSHVKAASGCQVSLRVLGEGLSLNFKDTSFNSSGLEVTHEDSSQESKGEVRRVMFSDTKCDVCPSPISSSILPHQGGVWQFSSILTHNYQELASDSTCLRAQPHNCPHCRSQPPMGCPGCPTSAWVTTNWGVPKPASSGLAIPWVQERQLPD